MTDIREFMTGWFSEGIDPYSGRVLEKGHMLAWSDRKKEMLLGTAKGKRYVPCFRPFDMLNEPNQSVALLENEDQRIGAESVVGAQEYFLRYIDSDQIYFQFAGNTSIETEFGVYDMSPGDLMLIPAGIAHRSTGSADSLRIYSRLHEPVIKSYDEEMQTSHTAFDVVRKGAPEWVVPAGFETPKKGTVLEKMITWRDQPGDESIAEREYEFLVEASSTERDAKQSGIRKIRSFDVFTEITGRRGPGPKLMESPNFVVEVYNTDGEQFAFHRALRSEEVGLQFRGGAINMSEFDGHLDMEPGDMAVVPLGIAHSVRTKGSDFMRIVLYSKIPWNVVVDPTKHAYQSTTEITTNVLKPAEWMGEAAE